ncbi:hypothetical protein LAB1_55670 [Roseibium sp. LAB1]
MPVLEPQIGQYEVQDINDRIARLLRDMGNPQPPLRLEEVRAQQKLDLTYYSKSDLGLLDEIAHRTVLAGKAVVSAVKSMREVVERYGIRGMLMHADGNRRIFIDKDEVKQLKRRFVIAHEIAHDLLDWHRELLLGDNESTLSPVCHQMMEAEANYGARRLIFLGDRFQQEARDYDFNWKTVSDLKNRFGNTLTTTLWQMICERDPSHPTFGLISKHPYYADICKKVKEGSVAYFPRSQGLIKQFPALTPEIAYAAVCQHATRRKSGPIGSGESIFYDANGEPHLFEVYSFCNRYDLLTYGLYLKPYSHIHAIGTFAARGSSEKHYRREN